jgi:hypothetical protein
MIRFENYKSVSYTNGCGGVNVPAGSTSEMEAGKVFELTAYGKEMGFHCDIDHGHFAYIELAGDFDLIVQVESASTADGVHHCRAGLMARKLPAGAGDMFVGVAVASNYSADHFADQRHFAARMHERAKLPGAFYYHADPMEAPNRDFHHRVPWDRMFPNEWLRLRRVGNEYMAWFSQDGGVTWIEHRRHDDDAPQGPGTSWTVDLGQTVALGFSLEASPEHSFNTKATARFRIIQFLKGPFPAQD